MIDAEHFREAQEEEAEWWRDCANTFHEEQKQLTYAKFMGLEFYEDSHSPYNIKGHGYDILDIGGGPSSLLLKVVGLGDYAPEIAAQSTVVDPCFYPDWVEQRYHAHGVHMDRRPAEELDDEEITDYYDSLFDEVWMYNVLQHTIDPARIVRNGIKALTDGGTFRVFEWVNTPTNAAHPHMLTREGLDEWFGREGDVISLNENGCVGQAYFGAFTY